MRGRLTNLAGQPFGRLTAIRRTGSDGKNALWLCRCSCGNKTTVRADRLRSGHTSSCGCLQAEYSFAQPGRQPAKAQQQLPTCDAAPEPRRALVVPSGPIEGPLTKHERAAIDEAIANGLCKRIENGHWPDRVIGNWARRGEQARETRARIR